jgi:hypothetical protein
MKDRAVVCRLVYACEADGGGAGCLDILVV